MTIPEQAVELLPCPFCGCEAAFGSVRYNERTVAEQDWPQDTFYKVSCILCGADNLGLVGHASQSKAAEAWNKRALPLVGVERAEDMARGEPQEGEGELEEIADGAWGDNPAIRGAARDRLRAAAALPPLRAREEIAGDDTADIRWAVNVLLEKIAAKFEAIDTWDIWKSDAASLVRSFKHDLSSTAGQEWRDISSAPKDDLEEKLVFSRDGNRHVAIWSSLADDFVDTMSGCALNATRWMPLPTPPVAEPIVAEKSQS